MTSRSLRNHRTTTVPLWILTSGLATGLAFVATSVRADDAAETDPPIELPAPVEARSLPPVDSPVESPLDTAGQPRTQATIEFPPDNSQDAHPNAVRQANSFSATHQAVMRDVVRTNEPSNVEFVQAQVPANPNAPEYGFRISTEPPTRERLFRVLSPEGYLTALEAEYRKTNKTGTFFVPLPADVFNAPNADTLPVIWYQSRKTGPLGDTKMRGHMGIFDNAVQQNVSNPPEVAIINESVGTTSMWVRLKIELGSATSQFGVVFRAGEPRQPAGDVDQIDANTYFYALFSETTVGVYFHRPGEEAVLLKSETIAPKRSFEAGVTAYDQEIRVLRDGEVVLTLTETTVPEKDWGKYCGMVAGVTEGAPTRADDFWGRRYGGEFVARQWEPSAAVFRGANVHYHPLYFEQVALERYGQHLGNLFAPWCAHLMFFADAACLPYSIGKSHPWDCHNDVCYYKPGDIVPFRVYTPICDPKGAMLQATAMALSWSLLP